MIVCGSSGLYALFDRMIIGNSRYMKLCIEGSDESFMIRLLDFFSEKQIPTKEMDGLLELIREKYPQDVECVLDIAAFLKQRYGYTLSEEEILYLSIHVSRIHQVSVKGGEAV